MFSRSGFNLSATREISIYRDDFNKTSEIFSSVMIVKTVLMFVCFIILLIAVFSFEVLHKDYIIYIFSFGTIIGNLLFPIWFFQGMENMKHIAILNLISKLMSVILIITVIKNTSDYIYVPLINSIACIVVGLISTLMAARLYKLQIKIPSVSEIRSQIINGWHVFISSVMISFYNLADVFLLGIFTDPITVGYYATGSKLVRAIESGLSGTLAQAVNPHVSRLASLDKKEALLFIQKISKKTLPPVFILSLLLLIFAGQISNLIFGSKFEGSIIVIRMLSFLPFLALTATINCNFYLLAFGYFNKYMRVILASIIVSFSVMFFFLAFTTIKIIGVCIGVLLFALTIIFLTFPIIKKEYPKIQ